MIPKIIYYNWTGSDPIPCNCQRYIDGWSEIMPDYKIIKITLADDAGYLFVREAVKNRKAILGTGYIKLKRLCETGGLTFDVDLEVIKRFDELLDEKFFAACERSWRINWSAMGAESNHFILKSYLAWLENINWKGHYPLGIDVDLTVQHYTDFAKTRGWQEKDITQRLKDFTIFNSKYFYPYYFDEKFDPGCITDETYAIHHWTALWQKSAI
jgi:hypothetical protein